MKSTIGAWLALGAMVFAACTDGTGPGVGGPGGTAQDRSEVTAALDASGYSSDSFSDDGAVEMVVPAEPSASGAATGDPVTLPRVWGRRLGQPINRNININIANDTARVSHAVDFDGKFMLDITQDNQLNPTEKPLKVTRLQNALLVKRAEADASGRRWKLVQLSPARWVVTDQAKRTVSVTHIVVEVNGAVKIDVTDPATLYDVDNQLPLLAQGDVVKVTATVSNTTGTNNTPDTFVFLHVRDRGVGVRGWARLPMEKDADGNYVRTWTVNADVRERLAVDAIDAQTFKTQTDDDYRSDVVAIPYRLKQ